MCKCKSILSSLKGKKVEEYSKNLSEILVGREYGQFLYRCSECGQLWEESLREAVRWDWPPILEKVTEEEAKERFKERKADLEKYGIK